MKARAARTVKLPQGAVAVVRTLPAPGKPQRVSAEPTAIQRVLAERSAVSQREASHRPTRRWTAPGGWLIESITLSLTPHPSRPGDPEHHEGPKDYLYARRYGKTVAFRTSFEELHTLDGLPRDQLQEVA